MDEYVTGEAEPSYILDAEDEMLRSWSRWRLCRP
jgi:hypothetical protein